ncbi:MAG: glycosyl transferase, partial [Candidatus Gastranaerophilales bacterium]|nr:glycosyl transferase [Candidatus Gastranaerophilales bacterium]
LIGAPVRQSEGVFREYLKSLDNLEKPDNVTIDRFFYLHNSPELAKLLKPDEYLLVTSDEDYKRDENTHEWKSVNLKIVTYLKNDLLKQTIEGDYDYFMLVDSDLILHPKTLVALFETDKPITAEVFWTKWQAGERPTPNAWDLDHFTFYQDSIDKWKNPGIYKVGGTGACILIHRSVIESGVNYSPLYNVSFWGEDRSFSIRATAHDYELWLDTHYPAVHLYRESEYQKYVENGGYEAAFSI